ncbi:hypothetical protein AV955_gp058 [Diadromus pulchellus ascovirus 4a]|uniref:Complete DpAV4 genome n=1 Tax=Diadromus pulchellus ascovirus 4a TaxID=158683 RepID=F2NYY7_9VIRU|nr:hypothetical protein AV955_gp058 [Diadromus pulchellus ascovirus 4a]CCA61415.1 unnamed protein product [Diadromus pulchellus ascovirus 4a]
MDSDDSYDDLISDAESDDQESSSESEKEDFEDDEDDAPVAEATEYSGVPYLTKYEKARVLGERTKQINAGAQIFVERLCDDSDFDVALRELEQRKMPLIVRRHINNSYVDISVNKLLLL